MFKWPFRYHQSTHSYSSSSLGCCWLDSASHKGSWETSTLGTVSAKTWTHRYSDTGAVTGVFLYCAENEQIVSTEVRRLPAATLTLNTNSWYEIKKSSSSNKITTKRTTLLRESYNLYILTFHLAAEKTYICEIIPSCSLLAFSNTVSCALKCRSRTRFTFHSAKKSITSTQNNHKLKWLKWQDKASKAKRAQLLLSGYDTCQ